MEKSDPRQHQNSQPKKRLWIRGPLTEEELASGQRYYSDTDISRIHQTFKARPNLDQDNFARRLETAARWFAELAAAKKGKPPSESQREWERRAELIRTALAALEQMDIRAQSDLAYAADELARRTGELPDFGPTKIELPALPGIEPGLSDNMSVWPVEAQIQKSMDSLNWLHQCLLEATSRATKEKSKPGNRPNESKHFFYRTAVAAYRDAAQQPKNPLKDRISGHLCGEVLDFIEACLKPLGVADSRGVIYDTYYRAGAKMAKKSRRRSRRPNAPT